MKGTVPLDAIDDFRDADDPETSLWDDDRGERRVDVLLALTLNKRSIGSLACAMLWQDDEAIGDDLGARILPSEGKTPYAPARQLHYHVSRPKDSDYERLALATARRGEIEVVTAEQSRNLIEDAYLANTLPPALLPPLKREIEELIARRFVRAEVLSNAIGEAIFDLRNPNGVSSKIPNAEFVAEADLDKALMKKQISKKTSFIMYCQNGVESLAAARKLWKTQKTTRVLVGGIEEWKRLGFASEAC